MQERRADSIVGEDPNYVGSTARSKPISQVILRANVLPEKSDGETRYSNQHHQCDEQKQRQAPLEDHRHFLQRLRHLHLKHSPRPTPVALPKGLAEDRLGCHTPKGRFCVSTTAPAAAPRAAAKVEGPRSSGFLTMCLLQSAVLIGETAPGGSSMAKIVSPRFGGRLYWPSIVAAFAVGIALVLAADPFLPQPPSLPTLTVQSTTPQIPQKFEPQIPQKFEVVDGDTVEFQSARYRLVGFNTPKSGTNAQCAAERAMAAKAVQRLHQLLASGEPYLQRVPCACAPGTEGTERCNYGRLCGVLAIGGKDVGPILIAEGLAEQYICGGMRCPPRRNWCRR